MNQNFPKEEILNILKSTRHFEQFEERQLSQLITNSLVEEFPKGNTIIQEGLKNSRFFVLLEGTVAVYAENEFISSMQSRGDIFGEMSVIAKSITTASIVAKTDVKVFTVIASDIFDSDKVELRSMVYKIFLDILTGKLALTTNRVKGFQATTEELNVKKLELAETEDDLVQKEIILQSVLESMSDGVVVTDNNGNLLHLNKAFCEMSGLQTIPDDFSKWPQELGLYHADETTLYSLVELPMMKVLKGQEVDFEEILLNNPSLKEPIWLQASSRLLEVENTEKNHGAVTVFRDYTKKKKEEQALIKAKETAEAMAKAKSDFLAVISHELRTPLNGIMGMTDLIYTTDLNPEQKDCMDTIKASSENLLTLVKNILNFNNIGSGTLKAENQPVSIKASVSKELKKEIELDQDFASHYPQRILVVEDNAMNQKLIIKVLEKLGYSPKLSFNGLEAVEMTRKETFDIILMDLQMPEMDGIEATKVICKEIPKEQQPTIIALTANVAGDVKQACFDVGMKDYMSKPLKLDKLASILKKWF